MSKRSQQPSKAARDNRANQMNPQYPAFHRSRGESPSQAEHAARHDKSALDNRANQLNPNNPLHKGKGEG